MSTAAGKRGRAEAARQAKAALAARERKRRALFAGAIAVLVLVVAGLIGWAVMASQKTDPGATPPSAVAGGYGFAEGSGPVTIDVYADFMCPICNQFEQQSGPTLDQLAAGGKATVVYHPIAILDHLSNGTKYSTRSAAASAAAADGGKFMPYFRALFAQQPPENSAGLSNDQLVEIGRSVGLGADFATKVKDGTYISWATRATDAASQRGVTGTPTVFVAGKELQDKTPAGITAAVTAANR
jgi:protein-disulfide isomerase